MDPDELAAVQAVEAMPLDDRARAYLGAHRRLQQLLEVPSA